MAYATLHLDCRESPATLTFNRPEKRNALSPEMIEELLAALDELEASGARVAIVTGAGKAFCAGIDVDGLKALATPAQEHRGLKGGGPEGGRPRPPGAN